MVEDGRSRSSILHHRSSALLKFYFSKHLQGVLLKDFQFILGAQESQAVDDRNEIVRRLARFWTHGAAGAGGFGAEKHLIDAALLDGGFEIINVIAAGGIKKIGVKTRLADVSIGRNKSIQA